MKDRSTPSRSQLWQQADRESAILKMPLGINRLSDVRDDRETAARRLVLTKPVIIYAATGNGGWEAAR